MAAYLKIWAFVFHCLRQNSWRIAIGLALTLSLLLLCPVAELLIIKKIAHFFIETNEGASTGQIDYRFLAEVVALYLLVQAVYFFTKINRVKLINQVAGSIQERENRLAGGWIRLIFLETTVQAIAFAQLSAIMIFITYSNALFGLFFVAATAINVAVLLALFSGEVSSQERMKAPTKNTLHQIAGLRMLSRTKSTEKGVLASGFLSAALMLAFILAVSMGVVGTVQGVVMIFAIRFYASIVSLLSGSMMRLARAFVFAQSVFSSVTQHQRSDPKPAYDRNAEFLDDV